MKQLVNFALSLWAIVAIVLALKILSGYIPDKYLHFLITGELKEERLKELKEEIIRPIYPLKAFILKDYNQCKKDNNLGDFNYQINNVSSTCKKDKCDIYLEFREEIPKLISLYIKKENKCIIKNFPTKDNIKNIGYFINLKLSYEDMKKFKIKNKNKINLTKAYKKEMSIENQYYFYKNLINSDIITYENEIKGEVFFIKRKKDISY